VANAWHHAISSARKWGGQADDYLEVHTWFDMSKEHVADFRHRALRHHTQGIFEAERAFGATITNSVGREIPVRWIGEQHVQEDCGRIPTVADWLLQIQPLPWMNASRRLSVEQETERSAT
jgi:hypothetical protein